MLRGTEVSGKVSDSVSKVKKKFNVIKINVNNFEKKMLKIAKKSFNKIFAYPYPYPYAGYAQF